MKFRWSDWRTLSDEGRICIVMWRRYFYGALPCHCTKLNNLLLSSMNKITKQSNTFINLIHHITTVYLIAFYGQYILKNFSKKNSFILVYLTN